MNYLKSPAPPFCCTSTTCKNATICIKQQYLYIIVFTIVLMGRKNINIIQLDNITFKFASALFTILHLMLYILAYALRYQPTQSFIRAQVALAFLIFVCFYQKSFACTCKWYCPRSHTCMLDVKGNRINASQHF